MGNPITPIPLILQAYRSEIRTAHGGAPNIPMVFDQQLSFRTSIKHFRSDTRQNNKPNYDGDYFAYVEDPFRLDQTLHRRGRYQVMETTNKKLYKVVHLEIPIRLGFFTRSMERLYYFQLAYLDGTGLSSVKDFEILYPDDLGLWEYQVSWDPEFAGKDVVDEAAYHKSILFNSKLKGKFITFLSGYTRIEEINLSIMKRDVKGVSGPDEVLATQQIT